MELASSNKMPQDTDSTNDSYQMTLNETDNILGRLFTGYFIQQD